MAKKKKRKKKFRYRRLTILIIILLIIVKILSSLHVNSKKIVKLYNDSFINKIVLTIKNQKSYDKCMESNEVPDEVRNNLKELEDDLNKFLTNNGIGFKYQEINLNYELSHNSSYVYYGASLIKLLDADYLIDNDVDLSITKKYEGRHRMDFSSFVSKHQLGDELSLEDLVRHAISESDNSAHLMLIDYIGFKNLQDYGYSLGTKVTLEGGDLFGNQTADDMIIILRKAYELINDKDNGNIIKDAMLNTEVNYLNFDDVVFGHKYGSYNAYFHDVGIYFSEDPYLIAILTTQDGNKKVVTEVSKKVYNIHNKLLEEKENYCRNK